MCQSVVLWCSIKCSSKTSQFLITDSQYALCNKSTLTLFTDSFFTWRASYQDRMFMGIPGHDGVIPPCTHVVWAEWARAGCVLTLSQGPDPVWVGLTHWLLEKIRLPFVCVLKIIFKYGPICQNMSIFNEKVLWILDECTMYTFVS